MSNKSIGVLILCGFLSMSIGTNLIMFDRNEILKKEVLFLNKVIDVLISEMNEKDRIDIKNRNLVTWISKKN